MIAVDAWHPADGLTLEPNALRAATELKHCLALTAGPGAGKTEMLAQRADFLLRTGSCRYPKRILAISFKVDASKNLKERVLRRCGLDLASRFDSYTFHAFAKRVIDRFRPILTGRDALDVDYKIGARRISQKQIEFGDLVPLAIQILKTSAIARNAIRQTYSDVFLDEFQDCTNLQYQLVKLAFQGTAIRLTAVGDTKQKIMGWAGALDGIFKTFAVDFKALPLNMYRNFRSKPRLLRMQNEIIRVLDPASVMPEEQLAGEEGEIFTMSFENSQLEADNLTELITAWINTEEIPPSEIAVLVSKQPDLCAEHLMAALERSKTPFRNEQQMQDISAEPAARLIVDYLSCLYGQQEPKAWIRLKNQLAPFADEDTQVLVHQNFERFIKAQRKRVTLPRPGDEPCLDWWNAACNFLDKIGIDTLVALSPDYESHARLEEVIQDVKTRIEEILNLEPDLPTALHRFSHDQTVRILTIHKSKGLEFDSVIVLGVEEQMFWGTQNDKRCAFFVGVSRAKRRLVLTASNFREKPSANPPNWKQHRTPHEEFFGYAMNL
ncbi:Superfamily I DNA or RNA helicase [Desulfomicrobium norvegicum]|uniref:DNA 3'-5' helicase n=1 Tax=Desulfomicrobium norvegicum (strain DSM 1741 / NCIMB 8310) TaxID=52561 RepID=A0A8G2C6B8_DESNO|nr:ATP-dependent helicase [Desulfomicrobium norvegicum]SFM23840.1 Superfamily I DNA or RNA helicase [Desulfomicrobium norvegicum]